MISDENTEYPSAEDVLIDIGEKAVRAFSLSITRGRADLRVYREMHPGWVADHSETGLANWISDRIWAHLLGLADGVPGMEIFRKGVTREITIGLNYRFRVKRHDEGGKVSSYETPTFLEFVSQDSAFPALPGMEETRLIAGYEWQKDLRSIGEALVSLRDGRENIIWRKTLPEFPDEGTGESGGGVIVTPDQPGPTAPTIDIPDTIGKPTKETAEEE